MTKKTKITKAWWTSFLSINDLAKDYGDAFVWTEQELKLKQQLRIKQKITETIKYRDAFSRGYNLRAWVNLTDKDWDDLYVHHHDKNGYSLSVLGYEKAIEAKLKEKNK